MKIEKISSFQLFCLIILFEIGTAAMVPLGTDAKQDAWISIALGMVGGLCIFSIYAYLQWQFPKEPLIGYVDKILGRQLGAFTSFLYLLFFIYGAARDLRDGMELLQPAYNATPLFVIGLLIMGIVCYALYGGIETLARAGEIYFYFFLTTALLSLICLLLSDVINMEKLLPVLQSGWKPIITAAYEQTVMFPFGELICFTIIFPGLIKQKQLVPVVTLAIFLSGATLTILSILEIAVLGAPKIATVTFPFLRLMQYINIGDTIQRLDAFVLISLVLNDFFKVAIFSYAALASAAYVLKVEQKPLLLPITALIFVTSLAIAPNTQAHFEQGKFALQFIFPPFILYIPFLLMVIQFLRVRLKR